MTTAKIILITFIAAMQISISYGQSIVINEVVYTNRETLTDLDGDTPDYIELYNNSRNDINLSGYQLTDDTTGTDYWTFPNYTLKAGDFLLVFASNKNKVSESEFHTDFRLSIMNDPLYLINPSGELIDKVEIQCIPPDHSLSRKPDGAALKIITPPTPGSSNNNTEAIEIDFSVDSLIASHASGFYNKEISLNLSKSVTENTIYYTLNGDEPDNNSLAYANNIDLQDISSNQNRFANIPYTYKEPGDKIFKGNIVRAQVFSSGCPASNEISNVYFIDEQEQANYNVPVISIITEDNNLFDDEIGIYTEGNHTNFNQRGKAWERPAHIEMFDKNKKIIIEQDAGIRISGKGSRSAPQKSLRLYARSEYNKEYFEYPFFAQKPEIGQFKTLLLRSSRGLSGTLLKDELTQNLVRNMNIDYSGTQTAIAFINGEYWGIYSIRERLDEGYIENNYNIKDPKADIIRHSISEMILEEGTWDNYDYLTNFLNSCDPESIDFYQQASQLIDIPELIDYYIAQMFFANYDFPHNNLKMWRLEEHQLKWRYYFFDCDACMINVMQDQLSEYTNDIDKLQIHVDWSKTIFKSLLQNEQFRAEFSKAYYYHIYNTFNPEKVLNEIERLENVYDPLAAEHTYRWHLPEDYIKWKNNVDMLKVFAMLRPSVQIQQLGEILGGPFKIYPNPSNGSFNIAVNTDYIQEVDVRVFSSSGTEYFRRNYTSLPETTNLDLNLSKGLYIVQISSKEYIQTEKLIIK